MASQTIQRNIHNVEGIGPIVLFIKKKLSTIIQLSKYMHGGRTHNFIHLHMCSRRNVLPKH